MKTCSKCKLSKTLDCFDKQSKNLDGLRVRCKECSSIYQSNWRAKNKERVKADNKAYREANPEKSKAAHKEWIKDNPEKPSLYKLKKYWPNLSCEKAEEEYNKLLQQQNECCAVCKKHQSTFARKLAVDHCHVTGKVRSLLCGNCNLALGQLFESEEIVESLLSYIKIHKTTDSN